MKTQNGTQFVKNIDVMKKLMILLLATSLFACTKEEVTKIVNPENPATAQGEPRSEVTGTVNGGGGKGVVCKKNGEKSVETLDLYEARVLYGLEIRMELNNEEEAINTLAALVGRHYRSDHMSSEESSALIKEQIRKIILSKMKFITTGKKLKLTNDSFEPLIEKDCEMVQLAHFYDESILLVDKALWDEMNWTNKIALVAHELFYYIHRQRGASNSVMSRKIVGHMFSTKGARPLSDGIPEDLAKSVSCHVENEKGISSGYLFGFETKMKNPMHIGDELEDGVEFVFVSLSGHPILFRTSMFLGGLKLSQLIDGYSGSRRSSVPILTDSYDYDLKLTATLEFGEARKFKMTLMDESTGESKDYTVSCSPRGGSSQPVPVPVNPDIPPATSQP